MAEPIVMPFWAWTVEGPGTVCEMGGWISHGKGSHAQTCQQSVFSQLFARRQQQFGLLLPVFCSNLLCVFLQR